MKKKISKVLAGLLAVALVLTGMMIVPNASASAAENPALTLKIDKSEAKPGDQIHAELWIKGGVAVTQVVGPVFCDVDTYTYVKDSLTVNPVIYNQCIIPIISDEDAYTTGGFSVLLQAKNGKSLNNGVETLLFSFDVTVNEKPAGTGALGFECKSAAYVGKDDKEVEVDGDQVTTSTVDTTTGKVVANAKLPIKIELKTLTLSKKELSLEKGATETLTVTADPAEAVAGQTITWKSSDEKVATVNKDGLVTAAGKGSAVISATVAGKTAECKVTVIAPLKGVKLDKTTLNLKKGQSETLTATADPADADGVTPVEWSSSDSTVASVGADGKVTALKDGTTTITAKIGSKSATCTVEVKEIKLESISLNEKNVTIKKGEDPKQLIVTYNPDNTTDDRTATWSSDNEKVATVKDGVVTPVGAGTATITATVAGKTATCEVTVLVPIESISLNKSNLTIDLEKGETSEKLEVTYAPADTTDPKEVTWKSSDDKIATVDENGVVTAVKGGSAVITATTKNGKTAECKVLVPIHVKSLEKAKDVLTECKVSQNFDMNKYIVKDPVDATDTIVYESSDKKVAVVNNNGIVTIVGPGKAELTATVKDNSALSVKIAITATHIELKEIAIDKIVKELEAGEKVQLAVVYNPKNTTVDKTAEWTSSNTDVASVKDGLVQALKEGTTTITVKVGDKTASFDLTVTAKKVPTDPNKDTTDTKKTDKNATDKGTADKKASTTTKGNVAVKTGDTTGFVGIVLIMILSISVIGVAVYSKLRKRNYR